MIYLESNILNKVNFYMAKTQATNQKKTNKPIFKTDQEPNILRLNTNNEQIKEA